MGTGHKTNVFKFSGPPKKIFRPEPDKNIGVFCNIFLYFLAQCALTMIKHVIIPHFYCIMQHPSTPVAIAFLEMAHLYVHDGPKRM